MDYFLSLNKDSKDKRVAELAQICEERGVLTAPSCLAGAPPLHAGGEPCPHKKGILFVEPRAEVPQNAHEYEFVFGYAKHDAANYVCLSDDEVFVTENNYLSALAMRDVLIQEFGRTGPGAARKGGIAGKKILVVGYGKLAVQLEHVLADADLHVLNFNHHKVAELHQKYGEKAFFEKADLKKFPVVINTVPKQIIKPSDLVRECKPSKPPRHRLRRCHPSMEEGNLLFYELASLPYGVDFGGKKPESFGVRYEILAGLPGKFYPREAAQAVFDAIMRHVKPPVATQHLPLFKGGTERPAIVFCVTGSSCNFEKVLSVVKELKQKYDVIPVISPNANVPNRFCDIEKFRAELVEICGRPVVTTIAGAEVLSSNKNIVASVVLPATGNTIAKLAGAITDTPVTMAVKALLRNCKPCVIGVSTNDALSGNAANIGKLLQRKNYYFVPFSQDAPAVKPFSIVCDFDKVAATLEEAMKGRQLQPVIAKSL